MRCESRVASWSSGGPFLGPLRREGLQLPFAFGSTLAHLHGIDVIQGQRLLQRLRHVLHMGRPLCQPRGETTRSADHSYARVASTGHPCHRACAPARAGDGTHGRGGPCTGAPPASRRGESHRPPSIPSPRSRCGRRWLRCTQGKPSVEPGNHGLQPRSGLLRVGCSPGSSPRPSEATHPHITPAQNHSQQRALLHTREATVFACLDVGQDYTALRPRFCHPAYRAAVWSSQNDTTGSYSFTGPKRRKPAAPPVRRTITAILILKF